MRDTKQTGFSLIELLVVIAIIGLLTTIAMVGFNSARQKARDTKRVADVRQIMMSLEVYNNNANGYPIEEDPVALGEGEYAALCEGGFKDECDAGENVYHGSIPSAPMPRDGGCSETDNEYSYYTDINGEFVVEFCLGHGVGDFDAGIVTATPSGIIQP